MGEKTKTTRVNGYTLVNPDKVTRALEGSQDSHGLFQGGVRKPDGTFDADELLVEYDRIGGLIRKGEDKVHTGSFYDVMAKRARAKFEVKFEYRINGDMILVPEGAKEPVKVKAAKIVKEAKEDKKEEKKEEKVTKKATKKASK